MQQDPQCQLVSDERIGVYVSPWVPGEYVALPLQAPEHLRVPLRTQGPTPLAARDTMVEKLLALKEIFGSGE